MGGDKLVAAVAGDEVEERSGDEVRDAWEEEFDRVIDEVAPLDGARELIEALRENGHDVVLASSSIQRHLEHLVGLLGIDDLPTTSKDDVERSKPHPDLVHAALEKTDADRAILIGDTPWDVEAARRAGVQTVCVLTGGFSEQELRDAGAEAIQLSGVRVVASTALGLIPDGIDVAGLPLRAPYRFAVIGDPRTLAAALAIPGGVIDTVARRPGAHATVTRSPHLTITALQPLQRPRYARPAP